MQFRQDQEEDEQQPYCSEQAENGNPLKDTVTVSYKYMYIHVVYVN